MSFRFSIIIPVYQEKNLDNFLSHLLTLHRSSEAEIIVVDALESTSTFSKEKFPQVRYLISETLGRGSQMNKGAQQAKGDFLFFLHSDSKLSKTALNEIASVLLPNSPYTIGCFFLRISSTKKIYRTIESLTHWRNTQTHCPYGDQGYFLKKEDFFSLGQFKEIPLMEDINFMEKIRFQNKKVFLSNTNIYTSARKWEKKGIIFNTMQNLFLRILYKLGVSPYKLAQFYWKKTTKSS